MTRFTEHAQGSPCWTDLMTTDPEAAKRFYTELFGWSYEEDEMPQGGTYSLALVDGGAAAAIAPMPPDLAQAGAPPVWVTYLAADDVDGAAQRVTEAGGQVQMPPTDIGDAGRMAFVADPVGASVGLWQAKGHIGAQVCNTPGALTWNELVTDRVAEAAPFYDRVLGLTSQEVEMAPGVPYTLLKVGDRDVAGATAPQAEGVPAHWNVWFAVADAEASAQRARDLGAEVLAGPLQIPVGTMVVLRDPQGAVLNLLQHAGSPPE